MTEWVADKLTNRLIEYQLIDTTKREIYHYTIQVQVEKIIGMSAILILGLIFQFFFQTVLFLIFFFCIRKRSGGFHMNSFTGCFLGTIGVYVLYVVILYPVLLCFPVVNYVALILGLSVILLIGAVNHPNMEWNEMEYRMSKRYARIIAVLETICIGILICLSADFSYIFFMSYGVILSAALLALGKVIKQEVET